MLISKIFFWGGGGGEKKKFLCPVPDLYKPLDDTRCESMWWEVQKNIYQFISTTLSICEKTYLSIFFPFAWESPTIVSFIKAHNTLL